MSWKIIKQRLNTQIHLHNLPFYQLGKPVPLRGQFSWLLIKNWRGCNIKNQQTKIFGLWVDYVVNKLDGKSYFMRSVRSTNHAHRFRILLYQCILVYILLLWSIYGCYWFVNKLYFSYLVNNWISSIWLINCISTIWLINCILTIWY